MRAITAALLSLVSLLGGHCLNQRWDRVVVFGVLAVAVAGGAWVAMGVAVEAAADAESITSALTRYGQLGMQCFAALLLVSAGVAAHDARRRAGEQGLIAPMLAGGMASLLIGLAVAATAYTMVLPDDAWLAGGAGGSSTAAASEFEKRHNFYHHIHLGSRNDADEDAGEPPTGDAAITGRVIYQGEPQAGVLLRLGLNGKYETALVETDEEGRFSIPVPAGQWRINRIKTQGWTTKPDDARYTLISGHEPAFELPYRRARWRSPDPLTMEAKQSAGHAGLTLTIRRALDLRWPPESEKPVTADVSADALQWQPQPGAQRYAVRIEKIEQEGDRTSYTSTAFARTEAATRLPLSDLPVAEAKGETSQYTVTVYAFDESGQLLNHSDEHALDARIRLKDREIVSNEKWLERETPDDAEPSETVDWQARSKAQRRLGTVSRLIDEELYDAADKLIGRVTPDHAPPGEIPLMRGYLAASRGRCDAAEGHFVAAREAAPGLCISACYRADCPKPESGGE